MGLGAGGAAMNKTCKFLPSRSRLSEGMADKQTNKMVCDCERCCARSRKRSQQTGDPMHTERLLKGGRWGWEKWKGGLARAARRGLMGR